MCHPVLPAYFFRVDAKWAAVALARARQSGRGACAVNLSPNEDLLMSPGLERQAIEDLNSSDPSILRSAQTLLQLAGSAAAEQPLLQAFARLRASGADMADPRNRVLEQEFVNAVLNANRWLPSQETFNQATTYCATEECRKQVTSAKTQREPPLSIELNSFGSGAGGFRMGTLTLHGLPQLQDRIVLFPKGTPFYLTGNSDATWYDQRHAVQVQKTVEDAGMRLVDRPTRRRP